MFKVVIILSLLVAVTFAKIKPCVLGNLGPFPFDVRIKNCPIEATERCKIVRGSVVTGEIDFVSTSFAETLRPEIIAYAFGVRAIYELPEDRQVGCNFISGTSCPLDEGEFATYTLQMPITDEYPIVNVDIEVRLYDQNDNVQFCALVEGEVVLF